MIENLKYKSLGLSIQPRYWDGRKEQAKSTFANSVRFNHLVQQKLAEVREAVIESETTNRKNEALDVLRYRSTGFLTYANLFIKRRESINKPGVIKRMRTVIAKVETYLNGKDIMLDHLDIKWLNNYEHYLLNRLSNSTNTVVSNMSGLRTILNEAGWDGTNWDDLDNGGTTGDIDNGTIVTSASVTDFNAFTIAHDSVFTTTDCYLAQHLDGDDCATTMLT